MNTNTELNIKLMQANSKIRELEQYISQADVEIGKLIQEHNRELVVLQMQIAELNSANVKYRKMLEEKSNG